MKIRHAKLAAGFVFLLTFLSAPAFATSVTATDLTGKAICWGTGEKYTFLPGGKFISKAYGAGSWQLMSDGMVAIKAKTFDWASTIERLADGSFNASIYAYGVNQHFTGRYCN
jgi:hypothetical protein